MFTFAKMIAPASRKRLTTVASYIGCEFLIGRKPPDVGMSLVSNKSFNTTGTPCNFDRGPFALRSASNAFAI